MDTTTPRQPLVDDSLTDLSHTVLSAPRQSLPEALGLPPDTPLHQAGLRSPVTIRKGRKWVEIHSGK